MPSETKANNGGPAYSEINEHGHAKGKSEIVLDIAEMLGISGRHEMALVQGGGNRALYLNNYRIAGGKPWGGGTTIQKWDVEVADVLVAAIPDRESALRIAHLISARGDAQ